MEKRAIDMVSKNVQNALKCKGLTLSYNRSGKSKKVKYKRPTKAAPKPKALPFFRGYDLLENMMVVRQYIQKKNNIDIGLLEILLYLAPKQYFTQADINKLRKAGFKKKFMSVDDAVADYANYLKFKTHF